MIGLLLLEAGVTDLFFLVFGDIVNVVVQIRRLHVQLHIFDQVRALVPPIALVELVLVLDQLEPRLPSAKIVVTIVIFVLFFLHYVRKTFDEAVIVVAHLMSRNGSHRSWVLHW